MRTIWAFLREDRGSYTIEFCLWIPMFLVFLAATVDASLLYMTHNNMWNAARDTARRASTGEFKNDEEIIDHLEGVLLLGGNRYFLPITEMIDRTGEAGNGPEVRVAIQTTIADASLFNIFGAIDWWFGAYSPGEENYGCASAYEGNIMSCALHAEVKMRLEPALANLNDDDEDDGSGSGT